MNSPFEYKARELEAHANALEADAKECRFQAMVLRRADEYAKKASAALGQDASAVKGE